MKRSVLPLLTFGFSLVLGSSAWPSEPNALAAAKKVTEVTGPWVTFRASIVGAPEPLRESPDGQITVQGGRFYYKVTGQALSGLLSQVNLNEEKRGRNKRTACWAFSPDGKLLAIGTAINVWESIRCGAIVVWDLTTGKIVACRGGEANFERDKLGPVSKVAFSQDSQTLYYSAGSFELSGK